jgi:Zn-dependent metalloprotease
MTASAIPIHGHGSPVTEDPAPDPANPAALARLAPPLADLGLDDQNTLEVKEVTRDAAGGSHVRLQQRYRGLRVWGGQVITHRGPGGESQPSTSSLVPNLQLQVVPNLGEGEALARAQEQLGPKGTYARPPTAELVIYPESALEPRSPAASNAEDFTATLVRVHLAYHIHMELENGAPETRHVDFMVDAQTGAILKTWSSLFTARSGVPAVTTGHSQYNGEVQLSSLSVSCGYILSDPTRSNLATRNLAGRTSGLGTLFSSHDPVWGDGQNYQDARGPRSINGQTAAVDAHYGLQTTWDFYRNILNRDGIDGKGRTSYSLVHYAHNYDNAFWSDACFCMTFGDGATFKTLTALDVVGHEISHGLCHSTADLGYDGESGALNEANSDIFGTMISFYAKGASGIGKLIPNQGGRWDIGYDLQTAEFPHPLRFMYKPSLDGFSPDAWSRDLADLDVHFGSGPMNRAFYFLSQGASSRRKDDTYSSYLPRGMTGIGNDKATRIWWLTLSAYLTPSSRYVDARKGALRAAQELFGKGSPEVWAVRRAFKAINVGSSEPPPPRGQEDDPMDTST